MTTPPSTLLVIGGGPAGYVAAIRASQLGIRTTLVERDALGGICLNWGCIPTKALLHAADTLSAIRGASDLGIGIAGDVTIDIARMVERSRAVSNRLRQGVQYLLKKHRVDVIRAHARFSDAGTVRVTGEEIEGDRLLQADAILVATGASPRALETLPVDGERIWNYRHALVPQVVPTSMLVVGAGAIGMEFASFYAALGTRVTVVETRNAVLPNEDIEVSIHVAQAFTQRGIHVRTGTSAALDRLAADAAWITLRTGDATDTLPFDKVLVCAGVSGNTADLSLENTAVVSEHGCIRAYAFGRTDDPRIYAAGDVCGAPMLAHKASREAVRCVEYLAGLRVDPQPPLIPACTYCEPQVASVGLTESAARANGRAVSVGRIPFQSNGKALALGHPEGFVKTVFDAQTGELLGAHLVGSEVTELIQGLSLARQLEATDEDLMQHVYAHPTLSEAIGESALAALGRAIHS
jgi:dihydrolipoamide dehydrogenase